MDTEPPSDRGGRRDRPPDPVAQMDSNRDASPQEAEGPLLLPTTGQRTLCGPHSGNSVASMPQEGQPAQVTTPSDALERGGLAASEGRGPGGNEGPKDQDETGGSSLQRRSYAAAVRSTNGAAAGANPTDTGAARTTLSGRWRPRERHLLLATLSKDWSVASKQSLREESERLRIVALADSEDIKTMLFVSGPSRKRRLS
ncbi:hypothetical protein PF005_g22590 [Phytophthora fragariae]|uniref:Uncharacterized protein n=1 Tax=Phytophthora fragariae TaxID=53985 RepID=A0A6A3WH80_9STRA|nr:hypothetical protein PF003_g36170 [Phytophthora fragariae]KAE8926711.1 hypothetical protein PF009_g23106 [Phytophthora fragariae]KAE9081156.1 hypothetical protein PF007_g22781 [Phytophthora fragariae]KAE9105241.1 hypothetical protein PF006_g21700 [Phytophthora fragariae]KAE9182197.1 hypothetical protein PF005_g22590 [Phytophthora fragariae]